MIHPIGTIQSPFEEPAGTPIQPRFARGVRGKVVVNNEYADALSDIDDFERIWLIYVLDRSGPYRARIVPYRDTVSHGLFATRAPARPNPIGLSAVRLLERRGNTLVVDDLDILNGTPLLDIKPYVPQFDSFPKARAGWFDHSSSDCTRADGRFHDRS